MLLWKQSFFVNIVNIPSINIHTSAKKTKFFVSITSASTPIQQPHLNYENKDFFVTSTSINDAHYHPQTNFEMQIQLNRLKT